MPTPTVESIVGKLIRRCPVADYFLVLDWVEESFRTVWERRDWSWRIAEGHIRFNAVYNTGTCSITRGTDVVNFVGTALDATYIGRQWRPGVNYPIYTIIAVPSATSVQIDRLWTAADLAGGSTYEIYNAFFELASNISSLIGGVDPAAPSRNISVTTLREELDHKDPQRSYSGGPVVDLVLRDYAGAAGAARYEAWPHQKADKGIQYSCYVRMPDLSDDGAIIPPQLTEDVLLQLALAECAGWPGYEGRPNPYYRLGLVQIHSDRAERLLVALEVADQNRVPTDVLYDDDQTGAIFDAGFHQNHDLGWD